MIRRNYLTVKEFECMKTFWIKETQGTTVWIYKIINRVSGSKTRLKVKEYRDGSVHIAVNYEYPDKAHCDTNDATLEILTEDEFLIEIL